MFSDTTSTLRPTFLQQLPAELLIRIFILAQNPELRLVTKTLYGISRSALIRAQFLLERWGRAAALSERAVTSFRMASSVAVVDNLIKFGCDPRADSDWLVWRALGQQHVTLVILLLDSIRPDTRLLERYMKGAAMQGLVSMVDVLVSRYGGLVHHGGDAMMMLAVTHQQVDMTQHLMRRYGCDPHVDRDRYLRRACLDGCEALVQVLLPGADVHAFNDAALQNAVQKQHTPIVRLLLAADADPQANHGACVIMTVRQYGHQHRTQQPQQPQQQQQQWNNGIHGDDEDENGMVIMKMLLAAGADPRCQQDEPLRLGCRLGHRRLVELLVRHYALEDQSKRLEMVNVGKGMPLYEALVANQVETVRTLLLLGTDPNTLHAVQGLEEAVVRNCLECVELMARAGAKLVDPASYFTKRQVTEAMRQLIRMYFM